MKLKDFRIYHYKSIIDSNKCSLSKDITILAGKNESGKTAILEAIEDLKPKEKIRSSAIPITSSEKPLIECTIVLNENEISEFFKGYNKRILDDLRIDFDSFNIKLSKKYDSTYDIEFDNFNKIRDKIIENIKSIERTIQSVLRKAGIKGKTSSKIDYNGSLTDSIIKFENSILNNSYDSNNATDLDLFNTSLNSLKNNRLLLSEESFNSSMLNFILDNLPPIIMFKDSIDIIPWQTELQKVKENKSLMDFAKIANLNWDDVLAEKDNQRRDNILLKHSTKISGDFYDTWMQDTIELKARIDGVNLKLTFKEKDKDEEFKFDQRSKGFQWFLSFYLRMQAQSKKENLILVDEPGLYLHAKAQKNVLKVLEKNCDTNQVIITTHSPYFIDINRLYRVRLLQKSNLGTIIIDKIQTCEDQDTITPIITAIGYDYTFFSSIKSKNVIVEGISDNYYLTAFSDLLKIPFDKISLIPANSANKAFIFSSLLIGWGARFMVLLDNDNEGIRTKKNLMNKLNLDDKQIIFIKNQSDISIEDLFSPIDFFKYCIEEEVPNPVIKNSEYVKKTSKIMVALKFKNNAAEKKLGLTDETKNNFKNILNSIQEYMKQDSSSD